MNRKSAALRALAVAALLILSIWPAIYNHGPYVSSDTIAYLRAADMGIHRFLKVPSFFASMESTAPTSDGGQAEQQPGAGQPYKMHSLSQAAGRGIILGRSIYYGVLLYVGMAARHFWLTILLQAATVLLAAALTLRSLSWPVWPHVFYLGVGLAVLSDAPYFASLLLPDIFAGVAILAIAVLLMRTNQFHRLELVGWYLLLAASLLFHDSISAIAGAMLLVALAINLIRRRWDNLGGMITIALAIGTAAAGMAAFQVVLKHTTGAPAIRMPHLTARLIGTDYGTRYVRATCPGNGFAICQYAANFPERPRTFIWGNGSMVHAGFSDAPLDVRTALAQQNMRFALAVFRYAPAEFIADAVLNSAKQLVSFPFDIEFLYGEPQKEVLDRSYPSDEVAQFRSTLAYAGKIPVNAMSAANDVVTIAALALLLAKLLMGWPGGHLDPKLRGIVCWVFSGIVINAAVCGVLSDTVAPRYAGRIVWLLPLLAMLAMLGSFAPRREAARPDW